MTKEITKSIVLQEIQDKLKLREFEAANFLFDETVVPTYDIGQHLMKPSVKSFTKSITVAGLHSFFSVPADEKWHLHRYNIIFMTGAYTVAGMTVTRPEPVDYVYLDLKAAQSTSYIVDLPKDVVLSSGDDLRVYIDGYTSTGDLLVIIDVTVEKIR